MRYLIGAALMMALFSCSNEKTTISSNPCATDSSGCGATTMEIAGINSSLTTSNSMIHKARRTQYSRLSFDVSFDSILSAEATKMKIWIQQIVARRENGNNVQIYPAGDSQPLSYSDAVAVTLEGGIQDLATALGVESVALPTGTYTGISMRINRVAQFSGCVQGKFLDGYDSVTGLANVVNPGWVESAPYHSGKTYSNDPYIANTMLKFCTKANLSMLNAETYSEATIGSNNDFNVPLDTPVEDAELVDVDLQASNYNAMTVAEIRKDSNEVYFESAFTIDDEANKLTLAFDLNRMLRYFANRREGLGAPNPEMKAGTSYFFTTIFGSSIMLFAGDMGSIEGYQVLITKVPGGEKVPAWMTIIKNSEGSFVKGLAMPDDDNALTVFKGSLDVTKIEKSTPGYDLPFQLGNFGNSQYCYFKNFESLANVNDVGSEKTLTPFSDQQGTFSIQYVKKLGIQ